MPENVSIPGYELLEEVGSGSIGTVYRARQVSMDRLVAVKVLTAAFADDERFIERFYREARAVAKLNHPNIVTGIDVGSAGGQYYFVMEYVDGEEVAERVAREGPLPEAETLKIVRQTAQALEHAFKNGIIHRDVKPANIMLTREGVAKLADLGVAKQTGAGPSGAGGRIFGTPYYMSPEQARGEADVDIRADIYSLGATLYHLLAGKPPFYGDPPAVVMAKQIAEEPEDVRGLNPRISKAAGGLVACMMAKDPDDRPETPADLLKAVDRVAKGQLPAGMRPGPLHAHAEHHRRRSAAAEDRGAKASRSRGMVAAAVLGCIVLVGAIAVVLSMGSGDDKGDDKGKTPPVVTPAPAPEVAEQKPAPVTAPPKLDREAEARKALHAAMKKGVEPEESLAALRELVARFPGTKAAAEAAGRAVRIETKIKQIGVQLDVQRELERRRKRAKDLIGEGKLASAVKSVGIPEEKPEDPSGATGPLQGGLNALHNEILNLGIITIARTEVNALKLSKEGQSGQARRALESLGVGGVRELEERLKAALAKVEKIETERAEAARRSALREAEKVYTGLREKVEAELQAFRPGEAKLLLSSARTNRKFSPLRDRLKEDLAHVGYFEDVVTAALRGVGMLAGQTRGFAMRGGTTETGKILKVTGEAIEVETRIKGHAGGGTVSRRLELPRLADRQIADLALIELDNDLGETFLKLAVLYAVGGDVRAARRQIERAREMGTDARLVASVERRWITGASDELAAAKLLKEAQTHFRMKRYTECRKLLVKLRDEYSHTETYKRNYPAPPGTKRAKAEAGRAAPAGETGHVVREYWAGIPGGKVKDLTENPAFAGKPTGTERLSTFEAKSGLGENYGARVRGFVLPPADGKYVFWIYGDDASELWLSTSALPAHKRKIAFCEPWVGPREWSKHKGQESKPVELKRGRKYLIEVLHKERTGDDCLGVGWRLPDGTLERPIPGNRLSPPR